jgi:hypothetical protein
LGLGLGEETHRILVALISQWIEWKASELQSRVLSFIQLSERFWRIPSQFGTSTTVLEMSITVLIEQCLRDWLTLREEGTK